MAEKNAEKTSNEEVIHIMPEVHTLAVKLNEKERIARGQQLADVVESLESINTSKKTVLAEFNARLKKISETISRLSREMRDGTAMQPVDCELQLNYSKLTAQLVRTDSGEVIWARPMTNEQKQMQMNFDDEGSADAK